FRKSHGGGASAWDSIHKQKRKKRTNWDKLTGRRMPYWSEAVKPLLRVLYLPPWPPSITYRAWASDGEDFSLLRWFVERLVERHGSGSLLIACQDPSDRSLAEQVLGDLRVFVALCGGETLLEALGELSRAFPESHLAFFHLEMMFAPSDLLDRVCAHHEEHGADFT